MYVQGSRMAVIHEPVGTVRYNFPISVLLVLTSPLVGEVGESSSRVGGKVIPSDGLSLTPHPPLRGDLPHKGGG